MINALTLICAILDNHGLEWEFDSDHTDGSGSLFIKGKEDIINIGYKSLEISFYPDYFSWRKDCYSLKVCLFDTGSGKLIEHYIRHIRGSLKNNKFQK